MSGLRVAVVGATGLVGEHLFKVMEDRSFPVSRLTALASGRSAGRAIRFRDEDVIVRELTESALEEHDVVFFAAGGSVSKEFAPKAAQAGAIVIDNSSAFRMDPNVPLVVPEVNPDTVSHHQGIIANPNCSTIQLVVVLHVLQQLAPLSRVLVSTYQAVSGTGSDALVELERQIAGDGAAPAIYPKQIAFNVLPQCDVFDDQGYTREEWKIVNESRKILGLPRLRISATTARVPVRVGHSESVHVEFEQPVSLEAVRQALAAAVGVKLLDASEPGVYPTPLDVTGDDSVWVGRIRRDISDDKSLWLWIVADNLRKGAATNAVQIAERLVADGVL